MKKLLLALAVVFLLAAVVIAVQPTGERQGTEEDSAPPVTGVFGQCGNDGQCDDGDPSNGVEWCDKSTAPGHCEDCVPTEEVCDGLDNDCNGVIDEGTIICGVGACENTVDMCVEGAPNECLPLEGSEEICDDQIDNDCDGLTDSDDTDDCGTCEGGTCGTGFEVCDDSCGSWGAGYCFLTTENTGRCGANQPCAEDESCTTSRDCPSGEACFKDTCCGSNVCLPLCSLVDGRLSISTNIEGLEDVQTPAGN